MESTRTLQLACLLNASACLRSSSSEAGTKWFHVRNVSSRFWASAGARPRVSQDAMPAVAAADVRRKSRREGVGIGSILLGAKVRTSGHEIHSVRVDVNSVRLLSGL